MNNQFFKSFHSIIFFITTFAVLITIFFVPTISSITDISNLANRENILDSMQDSSITLSPNSGFLWPTPRIYINYISIR